VVDPPPDLAAVRRRLEQERERAEARAVALDRQLTSIVETAAMEATDDEHDPEGATIAFERAQATALRDEARRQVRELDAALDRLGDVGFGRCERCGEPIGAARLEARPATRRCVGCAELG
jgi:DnaK suppressor protein